MCRRGNVGRRAASPLLRNRFADRDPVSYTHLDVYKRQGVFLTGHISGADPAAPPRLIIQTRTLTAYVAREFSRA